MAHTSRLHHALHQLLRAQRVASLATLGNDGTPAVSMVPFAIDAHTPALVLHVSALAAHTGNMARSPTVSLMVMQAEVAGEPVHALPRVTLQGRAETAEVGSASWRSARTAYLARFPETEPMMQLGDFRLVLLHIMQARQIAGFGAARSVDAQDIAQILAQAPA